MKITILVEVQNLQTGWEAYSPGDEIDVVDGYASALILNGQAREGWGPTEEEAPPPPSPDYTRMSYKDLRRIAKERGLSASGKKVDLIATLEASEG